MASPSEQERIDQKSVSDTVILGGIASPVLAGSPVAAAPQAAMEARMIRAVVGLARMEGPEREEETRFR